MIKEQFLLLSDGLLAARSHLSRQIRRQTKSIIIMKKRLKHFKKSVLILREKKQEIGENLNRVARIRNELRGFVTEDERQPLFEWTSDDGIDSDNISNDSATDSDTEEWIQQVRQYSLQLVGGIVLITVTHYH